MIVKILLTLKRSLFRAQKTIFNPKKTIFTPKIEKMGQK
jgi:hypothetical protein